ncbi:MAG: hypothetical protein AB8E15_00765 [Bdellovibrionales bacterium]
MKYILIFSILMLSVGDVFSGVTKTLSSIPNLKNFKELFESCEIEMNSQLLPISCFQLSDIENFPKGSSLREIQDRVTPYCESLLTSSELDLDSLKEINLACVSRGGTCCDQVRKRSKILEYQKAQALL